MCHQIWKKGLPSRLWLWLWLLLPALLLALADVLARVGPAPPVSGEGLLVARVGIGPEDGGLVLEDVDVEPACALSCDEARGGDPNAPRRLEKPKRDRCGFASLGSVKTFGPGDGICWPGEGVPDPGLELGPESVLWDLALDAVAGDLPPRPAPPVLIRGGGGAVEEEEPP
mmetsp:Transcript_80413/g.176285  ORF Transcript_80413/g.176285 Transcript_80413/m.176285 type:complete len:171 (+) Transcript_80413:1269-1781(+)